MVAILELLINHMRFDSKLKSSRPIEDFQKNIPATFGLWAVGFSRVLEQLTSIGLQVAESGVRLVVGVTEDVEKLRNTFRTIQAVLEDAEERQVKEKAVKIWLDKLQNVAYNMEDVLDEWNTAILKLQIPRDDPSSSTSTLTSKVRSLIQLPSLSIPRLVQRRDIGIKIKELNERLQAISKEKDDFAFLVDITRNHNDLQTERPKTTYFVDVSQIRDRCQGLPLAAKALGGLLRFKRSREQWQRILDSNTWELDEAEKDEDIGIPNAMYNVKKLRSLLLDSNSYYPTGLEACLPKLFDQLTCLRTLSLWGDPSVEEMSIKELPKEIGKLIHLRYLSLEGNARLSELPETLCDLCNLQTLNIRSCCKLQKLPHGIEKLINLRHLQNKYTKSLSMPKGMQGLTFLQTLEEFAVKGGGGITGLEDLGKLIHVRGNLELKGLGNVVEEKEAREARLSTKAGLHSLTLRFDGGYFKEQETRIEDEALVFRALQPSQNLQILCIEYCVGPVFPSWMTSLTMLKILHIYWCNWESLPPMGKLRSLEYLTMSFMNVKKVGEEFLGIETSSSSSVNHNITYFPNLKELTFQYMAGWEEWEYEHEKVVLEGGGRDKSSSKFSIIMPKLEYLCIYGCSVLKTLPHQVLQSRALQQLEIRDSRILYKRFNKSTGDDWPSISHIPAVLVD
ncbi:hypothetical protein COLO4_30476 [Corchorus olitorius]|uniref:Uncharacterized protein n=1 Tax=Corchorus olitorius TaxID=93759 RepID=A0A1R3H8Q0_9ROSI|nr:hypothetical protein COLO4_30476 [Corchorus olitorius]